MYVRNSGKRKIRHSKRRALYKLPTRKPEITYEQPTNLISRSWWSSASTRGQQQMDIPYCTLTTEVADTTTAMDPDASCLKTLTGLNYGGTPPETGSLFIGGLDLDWHITSSATAQIWVDIYHLKPREQDSVTAAVWLSPSGFDAKLNPDSIAFATMGPNTLGVSPYDSTYLTNSYIITPFKKFKLKAGETRRLHFQRSFNREYHLQTDVLESTMMHDPFWTDMFLVVQYGQCATGSNAVAPLNVVTAARSSLEHLFIQRLKYARCNWSYGAEAAGVAPAINPFAASAAGLYQPENPTQTGSNVTGVNDSVIA